MIGYSDRVVRSFRWLESGEPELKAGEFEDLEKWQLAGQVGMEEKMKCHTGL